MSTDHSDRKLSVLFLVSGHQVPSTRYRILALLPALSRAGIKCHVASSIPEKYGSFRWLGWRLSQRLKRWVREAHYGWARLRSFDVIVIERELFDTDDSSLEERFATLPAKLVLDVDDAVFLNHPEKFERIVSLCDGVIAGNAALREVTAAHCDRVIVVPTSVDLSQYPAHVHSKTEAPVIGWIGTQSNLGNLKLITSSLHQLSQTHPFRFRVISGDRDAFDRLDFGQTKIEYQPWRADTALKELSRFDIGVMPLEDTQWTRFKCGFKLLQYMACSIPVIASPVGVNREIVRDHENGFLASSEPEWTAALRRLLDDEAIRHRYGQQGKRLVEKEYSTEVAARLVAPFFRQLVEHAES
jgi:glycosyltransferase involved in cell wall biosynthesis